VTQDWIVPAGLGLLALLATVLALLVTALVRVRSRTSRELAAARAETAGLRAALDRIERQLASSPVATPREPEEYTITRLGETPAPAPVAGSPAAPVDRALFADLVLRETVVRAASLAHGVRRALSPEVRHRVRFEVGREVKRSRKQRRADTRQAVREWEARQRAAMTDPPDGVAEAAGADGESAA
jgi:hypothetical protein